MSENVYVKWNTNFYKNYHKTIKIDVGYMIRKWSDTYKAYGPLNGIQDIKLEDENFREKDKMILTPKYIPLDINLLIMRIPREFLDIFDGLEEIRIDIYYRP